MDSDEHTGLIKVVHYGPVVGVTHLVRKVMCSILGELTEANKKSFATTSFLRVSDISILNPLIAE